MGPSLWHIILVAGIFVLLFMGPSRLPGMGKSIGEAIRGFKKGLNDDEIDVTDSANDPNQRLTGQTVKKKSSRTTAGATTTRKKKVKTVVEEEETEDDDRA